MLITAQGERVYKSILMCALFINMSTAATVDSVTNSVSTQHKKLVSSQKRIDVIDDQTKDLYENYRRNLEEKKRIDAYDTHIQSLILSQQKELETLNAQIIEIENTQQSIVPLMQRMINALEEFFELDTPFLLKERKARVTGLKGIMDKASISIAEKYRKIMDAYNEELTYARTIEAYRTTLNGKDGRTVDFLRIGRVALYYQTLNGEETGMWDKASKNWVILDHTYKHPVKQAILIAKKQAAPDLMPLPITIQKDK